MSLRNSPDGYGLITRMLHWVIAFGVIGMIVLGNRIAAMDPNLSNLWLYGLHKSLGLTLFALVVVRLVWHWLSPVPPPTGRPGTWQTKLARLVHGAFYVVLVAIPLSGWVASSATGIDTVVFGLFTAPSIAPPVEAVSRWGFAVHGLLWKVLLGLLALHVAGALRHGLNRDGALRRILTG